MKRTISLLLALCLLLPQLSAVAFADSDNSGITLESVVWGAEESDLTVTCPGTDVARTVWAAVYSGGQLYGSCALSSKDDLTYSGTINHLTLSDYRAVTLKIFQLDAETMAPLCDAYSQNFIVMLDSDFGTEDALNVGYTPFNGYFSPFFSFTAEDQDVASMTQTGLLTSDRTGAIILNGIDGETKTHNGTDYTYYGIADLDITENSDGTVYYDFTLRDDVRFADGHAMDIDDVIFSMYVLCDPTYDGASTLHAQPILGLEAYRAGMETRQNLILATERTGYTANEQFTEAQYNTFWAAFDAAGEKFAQEIVEFCAAYGATTVAEAGALWGYSDLPADATNADFFNAIVDNWGYDLSDEGINYESAGTSISALLASELGDQADVYNVGVQTGDSAPSIEGIQKTGDSSLRVVMTAIDATSIYQLGFSVAPMHYYGEEALYDYDNNSFGFVKGDLSHVRSVTSHPMGAGPYQFVQYQDGTVSFKANDYYYLGTPKTQYVNFVEGSDGEKLDTLISGSIDAATISFDSYALETIKDANSNGTLAGDVLTTRTLDNLGYGYIGICADQVRVGDFSESDASKNLRKAFATLFAVYREATVDTFYGELAKVIEYPISNTSWAAPQPNDEGYEVAFSTNLNGDPIYHANMSAYDKYAAALNTALQYFEAAGYTVQNGMLMEAPEGASLQYEFLIPGGGEGAHPAYIAVQKTAEALASIGMTLLITDLTNASELWNALDAGQCDMWAAAWGSTVDPDLYQIYHSSNIAGLVGSTGSNHYRIADPTLDRLIMNARESTDQAYRKPLYKQCLDIILDWAVEIPVYQRQNAVVFASQRVDVSTVTPDITPFYGWMAEIETIELGTSEVPDEPTDPSTETGPDGRVRSSDQTYRTVYSRELTTLNYLATGTAVNLAVGANCIDPLVENDPYGNIVPCGATEWTVEDEEYVNYDGETVMGQKWTFNIREGQKWYDKDGNEMGDVTAHDYVAGIRYVCNAGNDCSNSYLVEGWVRGAAEAWWYTYAEGIAVPKGQEVIDPEYGNSEYAIDDNGTVYEVIYNDENTAVAGYSELLKVLPEDVMCVAEDDYTLVYHLETPRPYFLSNLCEPVYWPAPADMLLSNWDYWGASFGTDNTTMWYNGAYILDTFSPQDKHVLVKNENNWDAENIHITRIEEIYNEDAAAAAPQLFLDNEIDGISISDVSLWQDDSEAAAAVSPARVTSNYTYFYGFNFEPRFDEQYEPENWSIAVNTENFRQAIKAGLNRQQLHQVAYPNNYDELICNTITPSGSCINESTDYVHYGDLAAISAVDSFNETNAVDYMKEAIPEILDAGGHFPIIVLVQYNGIAAWGSRCTLLQESMEALFNTEELKALTGGNDVIQIEINNYGTQGFLNGTRRAGNYALQELNWGCDFVDPESFVKPFLTGNTYTFAYDTTDKWDINTKTTETLNIHETFIQLLDEAKAETTDLDARYEAFAKAEAYYINHAMVIPYGITGEQYQATRLNPFEGQYAAYGQATSRYKGMWVYTTAMTEAMYDAQLEAWTAALS